jgi:hypothetical protein
LAWGAPGPGVVVEGGHRSQIRLLSCPKYMKTAKKQAVSCTFWLKKIAKKYLTRYTHGMFFEENINF